MKRKLLSLILVASMIMGGSMTAFASNISLDEEGSTTGTTPSAFEVAEDLVGGGVTVIIPANLDLTYNSGIDSFQVIDQVSVYGDIKETFEVVISLANKLTYELCDSEETLTGYVKFGENNGNKCTETWNATEAAKGLDDNILSAKQYASTVDGYTTPEGIYQYNFFTTSNDGHVVQVTSFSDMPLLFYINENGGLSYYTLGSGVWGI